MPKAGYILCTTPRSGSTMLCQLLTATGNMGHPNSYFRREDLADWSEDWGLPTGGLPGSANPSSRYLEAVLTAGRGGTAIFGLRLMQETLPELLSYLRALSPGQAGDRACLEGAFGALIFVHLEREDVVSQAISLLRAEQSGLWHKAMDGTDIERLDPTQPQGYDFDRLRRYVVDLKAQNEGWRDWFDIEGITPLHLSYGALCDDPAGVLVALSESLSVTPPSASDVHVPTAQLRDHVTAEWKTRYARDLGSSSLG